MKPFLRRFSALGLCLVLCLCLYGCGTGKVFLYYLARSPKNLDPQLSYTAEERTAISALFTPLVYDEEGGPQPAAAQSWTVSGDGLTYTFTLKPEQCFTDSDGNQYPLTAADYAYGLRRVFLPETKSPWAEALGAIAGADEVLAGGSPGLLGVQAVNDTTLRITLSAPDSTFPAALDCPGAMPCREEFFLASKGAYGLTAATVLGNGSFTLKSWSAEAGVTLLPVEGYAGTVTRVRLPVEDGSASAYARLLDKKADAALLARDEEAQSPVSTFYTTTWALALNPSSGALANADVRLALCALAGVTADRLATEPMPRADGLVPPSVLAGKTPYRERAGRVLYTNGDPLALYRTGLAAMGLSRAGALTVLLPDDAFSTAFANALNQAFQTELSLFCNLKTAPLEEVREAAAAGNYDIVLLPLAAADEDVRLTLSAYPALLGEKCSVPQVQAALNGVTVSSAPGAEKALVNGGYICPLFYEPSRFAVADWVEGLRFSPFGPTLNLSRIGLA